MDYHEWATQMDYLNGRLNGLPKWTTLNYLPCNEKDNQSLLVLINNTKDNSKSPSNTPAEMSSKSLLSKQINTIQQWNLPLRYHVEMRLS